MRTAELCPTRRKGLSYRIGQQGVDRDSRLESYYRKEVKN